VDPKRFPCLCHLEGGKGDERRRGKCLTCHTGVCGILEFYFFPIFSFLFPSTKKVALQHHWRNRLFVSITSLPFTKPLKHQNFGNWSNKYFLSFAVKTCIIHFLNTKVSTVDLNKVYNLWHQFFYHLIRKSFQSGEEWYLFYCNSILGCQVIQSKLEDFWRHNMDTKRCNNKIKSLQVEIFQGWCAARTTGCVSDHDVTIALNTGYQTSSFLQWKLPYLLHQSLTDFLMPVLCHFHIHSHPLNEQQITLFEGGKLWFYLLNGEGLEPIVLPWKSHSGHY